MSKQDMRKELASLSFTEKIGILEKLRDRSLALSLVRLYFVVGPRTLSRDEEEARQKREAQAQRYLNSYLKSEVFDGPRSVLHAILRHWVESRGKVRLEIKVDGELRSREIASPAELDGLLGEHQTPSDLLRAIGGETDGS
jgi:hypothetical protein